MISEAISTTTAILEKNGVDESRLLAEYTLAEITGIPRLRLNEQGTTDLTREQSELLERMTKRLATHEPLQYVLGYTEFMGRRFKTDRRALIPRPETEELLATALDAEELWNKPEPAIVDVGTGTGCIAISLLLEYPNAQVAAVDTSPAAIELAWENEELHNLDSIDWVIADLLNMQPPNSVDAVVSNPPYITSNDIGKLDRNIREHEPVSALDGGPDGLAVYRKLIPQAHQVLKPDGWIFLEIGEDQGKAVAELLRGNGFSRIEIKQDLARHDRIAVGRKSTDSEFAPV